MTLEQQLFLTKGAFTLYEYPAFSGGAMPQEQQVSNEFKRWGQRLDGGRGMAFIKRLGMQGFDLEDAPGLFSLPKISKVAEWVRELEKILALMPVTPKDMLARLTYNPLKDKPLYDAYLSPVLFYAEQKLLPVFQIDLIDEKARMDIIENVFELVKFICSRFGIQELNKKAGMLLPQPAENLSEYYEAFTQDMLNGGLERAFWEYPALGRSLIESIGLRIGFIEELILNLVKDTPCNGRITGFDLSLGDTHNYGRSVTIVEYNHTDKIVYKPQGGELFTAYGEFLDFLTESNVICSMKYAKVLASYQDHCYIEFIEHSPITDKEKGAAGYYYRIGQLACLFYVLGTEDMHYENIIAHGEYPVAVDLETLLTGKASRFVHSPDNDREKEKFQGIDTVMRSLMFAVGGSYGGAALCRSNQKNVPFYEDGSHIDFNRECKNIIRGFQCAYSKIQHNRDIIIKKLALFQNCRFRSIIRSTQTYYDMLKHIYYTNYLKDGLSQSFEAERFFTAYKNCEDTERLKKLYPVFSEECRAVLRGDFPIFFVKADGRGIISNNQELCLDFFEISPLDRAKKLIRKMSDEDCAVQNKVIEMTLQSMVLKDFSAFTKTKEEALLLSNKELIEKAEKMFETIRTRKVIIEKKHHFLTIHTTMEGNQKGRNNIFAANDDFYCGALGFALFFGALYAVTLRPEYKENAVQIIKDIYKEFTYVPQKTPIGISDGVGGLAIVLYYLSDYLDKQEYKQLARKVIALPTDLQTVKKTDYLGGLAGYIIAAHKVGADTRYLEQAADRLVKLQIPYGNFMVWKSDISQKPLIGMGHGLSGVALAMAKAYNVRKKEEYFRCAMDALAYEDYFYDEERGWPDLRDGHSGFMSGFCSGAPGIGLARLDMLGIFKELDGRLNRDIERAIYHTSQSCLGLKDDVCCGNASGIDLLITAGKKQNNMPLLLEARKRLSWVAARKDAVGIYGNDTNSNLESIGFFNGICGVGYEMLRIGSEHIKGVYC